MPLDFVAIDFETANYDRASACAVGLIVVRDGTLVRELHRLIRPPDDWFEPDFTAMHGIDWEQVENEPDFAGVWRDLQPILRDQILVAHNAAFDRSVLAECLAHHRLRGGRNPFVCTVRLARRAFDIRPTTLAHCCRALRLPLKHHDALSDARACATIAVQAAERLGLTALDELAAAPAR